LTGIFAKVGGVGVAGQGMLWCWEAVRETGEGDGGRGSYQSQSGHRGTHGAVEHCCLFSLGLGIICPIRDMLATFIDSLSKIFGKKELFVKV
jgi:hypothetical protein